MWVVKKKKGKYKHFEREGVNGNKGVLVMTGIASPLFYDEGKPWFVNVCMLMEVPK